MTTATVWDYPAPEAIIRAAIRFQADIVVTECHHATRPFPWFLHFTDWDLVRICPFPVLLVKGIKPYHRSAVLAAVDPTHARAKSAEIDVEILEYGSSLATALGGVLHAVHARNSPVESLVRPAAAHTVTPGTVESEAQQVLDPLFEQLRVPVAYRHIIDGPPIEVIESVIRDVDAQILVMGAVSRSGVKRLPIGSTAEKILDRLSSDILIVKPARFGRPISVTPRGRQIIALPGLSPPISALGPLTRRV